VYLTKLEFETPPKVIHINEYGLLFVDEVSNPVVRIGKEYYRMYFEPNDYAKLKEFIDGGIDLESAVLLLVI